jgi:hypothetical protein
MSPFILIPAYLPVESKAGILISASGDKPGEFLTALQYLIALTHQFQNDCQMK